MRRLAGQIGRLQLHVPAPARLTHALIADGEIDERGRPHTRRRTREIRVGQQVAIIGLVTSPLSYRHCGAHPYALRRAAGGVRLHAGFLIVVENKSAAAERRGVRAHGQSPCERRRGHGVIVRGADGGCEAARGGQHGAHFQAVQSALALVPLER